MIKITQEKIDKLFEFYSEVDRLQDLANTAIDEAKRNKDCKVEVKRMDGKKSKVTEDLLWQEVWTIGRTSEGYEVLDKKYPDAFKKSDEFIKKSRELKKYSVAELGIDTKAIKLTDIIRLVESIIDFKYNAK